MLLFEVLSPEKSFSSNDCIRLKNLTHLIFSFMAKTYIVNYKPNYQLIETLEELRVAW